MSMAFMKKYIHVAKGIKVSKNHTAKKNVLNLLPCLITDTQKKVECSKASIEWFFVYCVWV